MSATLIIGAVAAVVILSLAAHNWRLSRRDYASTVLAEHWADVADLRGSDRDHLAWELRQAKRLLEQMVAERDKAVLALLTHLDRQQQDQRAVIEVCLHRISVLTARVTDLEASADVDRSVDEALAELLAADTRRTA